MTDPVVDTMGGRNPVTLPSSGGDVAPSIVSLLYDLNLLPTQADLAAAGGAGAVLGGPSQSVAVIESGATALSKWWAAGGSAVIVGAWAAVKLMWGANGDVHAPILWCAAIVSAAIVLGVAYLLASDVRGRAAATVETVRARQEIGAALIDAALRNTAAAEQAEPPAILPLRGLPSVNLDGADSDGWLAIAMEASTDADKVRYLLVKGDSKQWVGSNKVRFYAIEVTA